MKITYTQSVKAIENIEETPLKRRRWDRWLYLIVLFILSGSLIRWLLWPWVFNTADGLLFQDQFDVRFTRDIRIVAYKVAEKQRVKIGDTLFFYEESREQLVHGLQDSLHFEMQANEKRGQLIALEAQISKRKLFAQDLRKRLAYWISERARKEKLVYLGVITANELANVDRSIDDVSYQLSTIETEHKVLTRELQQLQQSSGTNRELGLSRLRVHETVKAYVAPVAGTIDRLRTVEEGVSYKQEVVTSVIDSNYMVRAYIDVKDLDKFQINDEVVVLLPYSNKKLQGSVTQLYSVMEDKDQALFSPINDNKYGVVVEVKPADKKGWDQIAASNIPVKIRKGRVNL